jgi:multicomponent Na+:H+ antiporter subunit B
VFADIEEESLFVIRPSSSLILVLVSRLVAPLIQLFAFYVIFHGHYSPGGGFQGGALLAASILLLRLSSGRDASQSSFPSALGPTLGAVGALAFFGTGLFAMTGGNFLDYRYISILDVALAERRSLSILFVEMGIALTVMATLVSIFDNLSESEEGS